MKYDIDFGSAAAQSYQQMFQTMLDEARVRNDGLDLTDAQTSQLRGRIALLKELLALPNRKKVMDAQARFEHPEI